MVDQPAILRGLELRDVVETVVRIQGVEADPCIEHHTLELHLILDVGADLNGTDRRLDIRQITRMGDEVYNTL